MKGAEPTFECPRHFALALRVNVVEREVETRQAGEPLEYRHQNLGTALADHVSKELEVRKSGHPRERRRDSFGTFHAKVIEIQVELCQGRENKSHVRARGQRVATEEHWTRHLDRNPKRWECRAGYADAQPCLCDCRAVCVQAWQACNA